MSRKRENRRGALAFEWIIIVTLIVIGLIGGLGALRASLVNKVVDLSASVDKLNTAADPTP